MTNVNRYPSLDQLDIRLIEELESDARQAYKQLAAKLGVDRSTIMKRVRRLEDGEVIKTICWVSPLTLGYKFIVYFAIDAYPGWGDDVANCLAVNSRILTVHLCTGQFNVVAWGLFRTNDDLSDFLSNDLKSIPGIQHVETITTIQEIKSFPRLLTADKGSSQLEGQVKERVKLDNTDVKLITELQGDARQNYRQLALKLGVDPSTVFRRIQRLTDEHIIRIGMHVNPFALGYDCIVTLGFKCYPGKSRELANAIASYQQVQYVNICVGRYDVTAWVVLPKISDLSEFINVELGSIPGLKDTETILYYREVEVKLSQRYPI